MSDRTVVLVLALVFGAGIAACLVLLWLRSRRSDSPPPRHRPKRDPYAPLHLAHPPTPTKPKPMSRQEWINEPKDEPPTGAAAIYVAGIAQVRAARERAS